MAENYAVETVSALPFGTLIGGPLTAAIDAQAQGAKATVDFIQDVGFIPLNNDEDVLFPTAGAVVTTAGAGLQAGAALPANHFGDVRMVMFAFNKQDAPLVDNAGNPLLDAQGNPRVGPRNVTLQVPLLAIVPIPCLSITEMTIDFVAKISEAISVSRKEQDDRRVNVSTSAKGGWGPVSGSLKGSFSSAHTSQSERTSKFNTEMTVSVHVRATSENIPKGLGRILDILEKAIITT